MGKLEGKVAVITGGSSGMALASAKRFVEEGAYVFITGRRQEALDEAVKLIGRNVTGVRGDAANLDDLDRLFDTVKREKGRIDVLYASAGMGEAVPLGEITEQQVEKDFAGGGDRASRPGLRGQVHERSRAGIQHSSRRWTRVRDRPGPSGARSHSPLHEIDRPCRAHAGEDVCARA